MFKLRLNRLSDAFLTPFLLAAAAPTLWAQAPSQPPTEGALTKEKGHFHVLNPTPKELMRPFATDRPDKTESPYTVDAGHFQVEMDLVNFSSDREGSTRARSWSVAPINFKVGLANSFDLQVIYDSYVHQRVRDRDGKQSVSGAGDLTFRLKGNCWGNDGGKTAFAIMPFVKIPTAMDGLGNRHTEGGIIMPLAVELPGGWAMGLMTEFDFLRNEEGHGYHTEFVNSVTFGHPIVGELSGYIEFFSAVSSERNSDWVGTVDVGLTYLLMENLQLDAGCNFGVTRAAEDVNPFVGVSVRF